MAKLIDENKLQRIKEAAIEQVVYKGYGGASISSIAAQADVASGYLYRFYPGKYELVSDLLNDRIAGITEEIAQILDRCSNIKAVLKPLVDYYFDMADNWPNHIRFIYALINDYNFSIGHAQRELIFSLCHRLLEIGKKTGEINNSFTGEEVFLMAVIYPVEFINVRFKNLFSNTKLNSNDKKKVTDLCLAALKG